MDLGERIALARKQAGLSQEQLGERLGVSRQAVSKWESNQTNPDVAYVAELCRICKVSCDWLLLGEESAWNEAPARCPSCGTIITGLDRFCPQCGHSLQRDASDTYSLVLTSQDPYLVETALVRLSRMRWCKSEFPVYQKETPELEALIAKAPVTLMWGLTAGQAREALDAFGYENTAALYRDSDGSSAGQPLEERQPVSKEELPPPSRTRWDAPLSFPMAALAAAVGVVGLFLGINAAVFLISML